MKEPSDFNPRSPHGERLYGFCLLSMEESISIHAPRTGSDCFVMMTVSPIADFNPRSPHGERRTITRSRRQCQNFNPRSPHGERRKRLSTLDTAALFQSTLPARGATNRDCLPARLFPHFNPRSPHGERPAQQPMMQQPAQFQSTLPARGATSGSP